MHRFIDGEDRLQRTLLPNSLEDYVDEENPVRVIEVFIDELNLAALGFSGMTPAATGRPAYHPMPSAKYSCSGSPVIFWNGSTASDGRSGGAKTGDAATEAAVVAVSAGHTR